MIDTNLTSLELVVLASSLIGAIFTFWRVVRTMRRASHRIVEAIESINNLFQLMQQEYNRNGGKSHKDLLYQILEKQDLLIDNQNQLIEISKELVACLKEQNEKTNS